MSQPAKMSNPDNDSDPVVGAFVAVVGPSGAGKDTLINIAKAALSADDGFHFVRRIITRPTDGATEDHLAATEAEFTELQEAGKLAFSWDAHDLKYGVPVVADAQIKAGKTVICNGSRAALSGLQRRYSNFSVISIMARRDVLASRLAARGRESYDEILERLERAAPFDPGRYRTIEIDNSGSIESAGAAMVEALRLIAAEETRFLSKADTA